MALAGMVLQQTFLNLQKTVSLVIRAASLYGSMRDE